MTTAGDVFERKSALRRELLERRRRAPDSVRSAESDALRRALTQWLGGRGTGTVCAYVPVRDEPGSRELLDDLRAAGHQVLLPIVTGPVPLDWAEYAGASTLRPARYGLLEPDGPRLGPETISSAGTVLVPALAVDHRGTRLGRGAGHYDRSLSHAAIAAELIGVVRDTEFVPEVPSEGHDAQLTAVVTPSRGVFRLPL